MHRYHGRDGRRRGCVGVEQTPASQRRRDEVRAVIWGLRLAAHVEAMGVRRAGACVGQRSPRHQG